MNDSNGKTAKELRGKPPNSHRKKEKKKDKRDFYSISTDERFDLDTETIALLYEVIGNKDSV